MDPYVEVRLDAEELQFLISLLGDGNDNGTPMDRLRRLFQYSLASLKTQGAAD